MANKSVRFIAVLFIMTLFCCRTAFSQEITAIDFNGDLIGKVIPDGTVVSFDNEIIGNITADSLIVNKEGKLIGGIVPQGVVIGNDNKPMGKVNNDGSVRLPSGKIIGKVLPAGLVVDDDYNILGAVLFPGLVYNDFGATVGRLTGDGSYISLEGQNIGFISANGYAYRNNGAGYVLDGRLVSAKMVVSADGQFIGSVVPGGRVTDFESRELGKIHANGYVYNIDNKIIGKIVDSSYAFDNDGKYLGLVSYNGEVLAGTEVVGHLQSDGKIINSKKEVIGFKIAFNATASDLNGKYLGRLIPEGKIVKNRDVVGTLGARGQVFDADGKLIGEIISSGPLFDYLGNVFGQSLRNAVVSSLNGTPLGFVKGRIAYDNIGRILGATQKDAMVVDAGNHVLGLSGIGAEIDIKGNKYKVSPFGYVFSSDNILSGYALDLSALYSETGDVFGYIEPNGIIRGIPIEKQIKLTQFGQAISPDNMVNAFAINPEFAVSAIGESLGTINENNLILDSSRKVVGKIVPEYDVIPADSQTQMPVIGSAGMSMIAVGINGNMLGYAGKDGVVRDYSGNIVGKALDSRLLVNSKNAVVGSLMPLNGVVNNECGFLGVVGIRGNVRNSRDVVLGNILTNGQVVSEIGTMIGYSVSGGTVLNFEGKEIGTLTALGKVINYGNEDLGCIRWDGKLYDNENKFIARQVRPAPVINFDSQISGRVLASGKVINTDGADSGFLRPDDTYVNLDGLDAGIAFRYRFAFDNDNIFMGIVNDKAEVINNKNDVLGNVGYTGVVTADGKDIGYALYDFYIYNEKGQAIGYLLSDGLVSDFSGSHLGKADKGFLLDRNEVVIGRGNRDYVIRDDNNKALGELSFDGDLIGFDGKILGSLGNNGKILDSADNLIAKAKPLQYYHIDKPEPPKPAEWVEKQIKIDSVEVPQIKEDEKSPFSLKTIGIALTPDGNYLGDILANNDVVNKLGELIGKKMPDGLIIDDSGNLIGIEEVTKNPTDQMFVPAGTFGPGNAYGIGNVSTNLGPGGGFGPGERYDPVRSAALAAAQAARRSEISVGQISTNIKKEDFDGKQDNWDEAQYRLSSWRVDMSEMILADKPIPAVLARTIMSGATSVPITAIVERNVYAEEGRNIVIPAGSRVIGSFSDGGVRGEGSVRLSITWQRLIRPDGSAFSLSSAQTGDAQGRAGAVGYVDEQLLKKYTLPIVTSTLESSMAYLIATSKTSDSSESGDSVENSKQQAANDARQNFLSQMDSIFQQILQDKTNIEVITYIPAGTRLMIYPMEDLWIRTLDRSNKENKMNNKEEVLINPKNPAGSKDNQLKQNAASNAGSTSGVVYEEDDVDVKPSNQLIEVKPKKKKSQASSIPPVTSSGATPPPPATSATVGVNSGATTPQLF